jgi:type IV secretion system protein VirD4
MAYLSPRAQAHAMAQNIVEKDAAKSATDTAHGSASFASREELAALRSGALLLGRDASGLLTYGGNGHLLTFAPTGAGKSVSVVVPNLLTYPGSVVCIDPKGAIAPITAARRQAMGQKVVLLDPFAEVERAVSSRGRSALWPALPPSSFDPLGHLDKNSLDAVDDVRLIASSLIIQENEKNRFFSDSARMVLEGLLLHLLSTLPRVTLGDLFAAAFDTKENFENSLLPEMRENKEFAGHVSHLAGQIDKLAGDAGASVWLTLYRSLNLIKSPRLLPAMQPSSVDFRTLKDTPTTVYLVLPAKRLPTHGAWLRLMLGLIIDQLSDARRSDYPVLFVVDECAALGRLEVLETAVGLMRGYGLKLWLVFQDLPQLKSVYEGRWQSFVSNAGVKQFFNVNDLETADFVSQYLGQETRRVQSENISGNTQLPGSNISATGRALLTPDEVRRLPNDEQVLFFEGRKPVQATKLSYFEDGDFKDEKTGADLFLSDPYLV